MPKVIITQKAQKHIDEIIENVVEYTHSLESGLKLFNDLNDKISLIGFMPEAIGRLREDGSREAFCRGYRIVYEVINHHVYIHFVIHSRRIYPRP
ncbi:type II toxin-antitoxin system RelE/ParE family toxin [Rodentibacter trehalosifermentans]|uniref:Plasmid stabilization system protein n=1 Tax=Rodentibacter trehalosifermentans TaxID=1908263 RepID=A0A1V3J275_9PAST|nr:type II toxin-antitoxin system RelE/ParE family toxin [Rodentibacter trehalosifermentans]OOF47338.1 plasmid stabilization system protein [Rodentibacter trehalosifermentans]OOF49055.1 plasmid stabilization system protein [Rodentibacter trehalosifermentans]OOF52866.1 plasmid stabilization system protein [Rodentibacter trehalosifermentans]